MGRRGAPKRTINRVEIGRRIAEARKRAGMTQEELRAKVGRENVKSISDWERGVSTPPEKILRVIARECGVPYEEIFTPEEEGRERIGKIVQTSMGILDSFDPIKYHLGIAAEKARKKAKIRAVFSASDLGRFEAYMEASIKNSMEFFEEYLMESSIRKGDKHESRPDENE